MLDILISNSFYTPAEGDETMSGRKLAFTGVLLVSVALLALTAALSAAPADEFGTNWTAQYFSNISLQGAPVFTEVLPAGINQDWGSGSPNPAVPADNFSARFTSSQIFPAAGTYQFVITSDDGARVIIDGAVVYDQFVPRARTTDSFQVTLTGGVHSLVVEYFDSIDQAIISVQWFQVGATFATPTVDFTVPIGPTSTATRIPPTPLPEIPPGALTATVIRASVLLTRSGPFLGAPVVGRILRGQTYAVVGRDADARWFLLQLSGKQGWAWGYYLFVNGNSFNAPVVSPFTTAGQPAANTGVAIQTQATLRLRAAPNTASEQIGRIPWGTILPVLGRTSDGGWLQVQFYDTIGFVAIPYVRVVEGDVNSVPVVQ
jgi:uncharacterized protein YraI